MQQPRATSAGKRAQQARVMAAAIAVASLSGAGAITLAAGPASQAPASVRTADIHLVTTDAPPPPATPAPGQPAPNPETPTTVTAPPAPPASPPPGAPAPATPPPPGAPAPGAPADGGRVNNDQGGFSYVVPQGWTQSDARRLTYGSALLTNPAAPNGSILLGRLDLKLFAGAEPDNQKAARRLASDMGEFFMPYPGNRVNQEDQSFEVAGMPAASSYYEVKFDDAAKEPGQIWAAAVGKGKDRWFIVWLGTAASPVDKGVAKALTDSVRPWTPPTPATPPAGQPADPNQPAPPPADPNQPPPPPADPNQPPPPPAPAAPGAPAPEPAAPGQPAPPAAPAAPPAPGVPV